MTEFHDGTDLQAIDIKSLTNEQWIALRRHIIRQAHAERSKVIAAAFKWLWSSRIDRLGGRHKNKYAARFPSFGKLEETS